MSPPKDLQLTFTVKLQLRACVPPTFLSGLSASFAESPFGNRHGLVWYLAQAISKRGIPVCEHVYTTAPVDAETNYKKKWNFDLRREATDAVGNTLFDLDLRSRVLTFNDRTYTSIGHVPGALEEVGHVMQIMNKCRVDFEVLPKHGLEVYVGLKKKNTGSILGLGRQGGSSPEAFELTTLQALGGLVVAAEPCINAIVAPPRIRSERCKTPSMTPGLAKMDVLKRIRKIGETSSVGALVELMNPGKEKNYAYDFTHILRRAGGRTRDAGLFGGTVEFRQHEMTLESQEVTYYLQVVAGTVRLALQAETLTRAKAWAVSCDGEAFSCPQFLTKIGKAHLIGHYRQKAHRGFAKSPRHQVSGAGPRAPTLSLGTSSAVSEPELGEPTDSSIRGSVVIRDEDEDEDEEETPAVIRVVRDDHSAEKRRYEERKRARELERVRSDSSLADSAESKEGRESRNEESRADSAARTPHVERSRTASVSTTGAGKARSSRRAGSTRQSDQLPQSASREALESRSTLRASKRSSRSGSSTISESEEKGRRDTVTRTAREASARQSNQLLQSASREAFESRSILRASKRSSRSGSSTISEDGEKGRRDTVASIIDMYKH